MDQKLVGMQVSSPEFDPRHEQLLIRFQATQAGYAALAVFGPDGAWLNSLPEARVVPGANEQHWDGSDAAGQPLADGEYSLELFGFDSAHQPGSQVLRGRVAIRRRARDVWERHQALPADEDTRSGAPSPGYAAWLAAEVPTTA